MTPRRISGILLAALILAVPASLLTGCTMGVTELSGPLSESPAPGPAISGTVHGGQQPVSFSNLQLYAAGTSGYGAGATALIPVGTAAKGYYIGGTPCISAAAITGYSIASNVVTIVANNTLSAGNMVAISGLSTTTGLLLDGQTLTVTAATGTQFTAAFTNADVPSTADSGTAQTQQTAHTATITSFSITSNVATLVGANNLVQGDTVTVSGLTTGTYLNTTLTVLAASPTQFTAAITHADVASTTDSGSGVSGTNFFCNTGVISDVNGDFLITGDYTCPSGSGSQIYMVATKGNPNYSTNQTLGSTNSSLALIDAIGSCDAGKTLLTTTSPISSITVNEATTVAAVTALQQFMSVTYGTPFAFGIGAPSTTYAGVATALVGLGNAFSTANVLTNSQTGVSAATTGATPEVDHIYEMANILSSCVNAKDGDGNCSALFNDAEPQGASSPPADTIQAMYAMATNPVGVNSSGTKSNYVSTLTALSPTSPPFLPTLSSIADFTVAVGYAPVVTLSANITAYSITYSAGPPVVDTITFTAVNNFSAGDVVTINGLTTAPGNALNGTTVTVTGAGTSSTAFTAASTYATSVASTPDTGTATTSSSNPALDSPYGIAIDAYGNAWVSNYISTSSSSVSELGPTGKLLAGPITAFTATGGDVGGGTIGPTLQSGSTLFKPHDVAIDQSNNAWFANDAANTNSGSGSPPSVGSVLVVPGSAGPNAAPSTTTTNANAVGYFAAASPIGIFIDGANNVWVPGTSGSSLQYLSKFPNASAASAIRSAKIVGYDSFALAEDISTASPGPYLYVVADQYCGSAAPYNGQVEVFKTNGFTSGSTVFNNIVDSAGSLVTTPPCSTGSPDIINATFDSPYGIAVDKNNNLWVTDYYGTSGDGGVTYLVQTGGTTGSGTVGTTSASSTSQINSTAAATTYGINEPEMVAVDGNNNAWVASASGGSTGEIAVSTASGSPVFTFLTGNTGITLTETGSKLTNTRQLAIDPSGNIWYANNNSSSTPYVTVLVGVAGPVVTPLSQAYKSTVINSGVATAGIGNKP